MDGPLAAPKVVPMDGSLAAHWDLVEPVRAAQWAIPLVGLWACQLAEMWDLQ